MSKQYNDYYTYAFLREDRTPYYIGKGRGNRIYCKNRGINAPTDKSLILYLKKDLTEAEAFKHEVYMIFVLGRKDLGTGILRNRTDGGEGSSGHVRSAETKKKQSEAMSGEKNPQYGVPRTEEDKKKISEALSGEKNLLFGVPRTKAQKKAHSEKMFGRFLGALHPRSKAIIAIEPDGTQRHFGGLLEATRDLEINRGTLSHFLKNGHVSTKGKFKGWQFHYKSHQVLQQNRVKILDELIT